VNLPNSVFGQYVVLANTSTKENLIQDVRPSPTHRAPSAR
jgi:hypothetical protein